MAFWYSTKNAGPQWKISKNENVIFESTTPYFQTNGRPCVPSNGEGSTVTRVMIKLMTIIPCDHWIRYGVLSFLKNAGLLFADLSMQSFEHSKAKPMIVFMPPYFPFSKTMISFCVFCKVLLHWSLLPNKWPPSCLFFRYTRHKADEAASTWCRAPYIPKSHAVPTGK